jgi:hypothetical protein
MAFINLKDKPENGSLNVSISGEVIADLDKYVEFIRTKAKGATKAVVVEEILRTAMKRDKEFKESQKAVAPTAITQKGKVA